MRRNTGAHPIFNTARVGHGATQWDDTAARLRAIQDANTRIADRHSAVAWTNRHEFGGHIGEHGWISPGVMRAFAPGAINYAWALWAGGAQTLPCPDALHVYVRALLALAHPKYPDEPRPLVRMGSDLTRMQWRGERAIFHGQLWVCRLLDDRDVMLAPEEMRTLLIPYLERTGR